MKVGSAGRFRCQYGSKIRAKIAEIEKIQRKKHPCPFCGKVGVKRVSTGIYECKHCKAKFAGKAYFP